MTYVPLVSVSLSTVVAVSMWALHSCLRHSWQTHQCSRWLSVGMNKNVSFRHCMSILCPRIALGQQIPRVRKESSVPIQEQTGHNVFSHHPKDPDREVCEMTKIIWTRCRVELKKSVEGISFSTQFGDHITAYYNFLKMHNASRSRHRNALIMRVDFTNWLQSSVMKTKESSETLSCF